MIFYRFSIRRDGNLSLRRGDSQEALKNRAKFFANAGISEENIVTMQMVHGNRVRVVGSEDRGSLIKGVDALVTQDPEVYLFGTYADCLPIFLRDAERGVIGLAHVGWKGALGGICKVMISSLCGLGVQLENLKIHIGPSIRSCCFEVKDDILDHFPKRSIAIRNGRFFVNLQKICHWQLQAAGVPARQISECKACTCCGDSYFSHRRDGEKCGAMGALVGIKAV